MNITPTSAHIRDDTLTPVAWLKNVCGRLRERNLSAAEVTDAAGGNLLTFMVSKLNRAANQKIDDESE